MLATDMESMRGVSPFTSEIKCLVPADRIEPLRRWARARLRPDPFGGGLYGDTYETHSVYFDTVMLDVYHRRGSYGRSKYRVRRYGRSTELFFERKLKKHDRVSKRRSIVDAADVWRLAESPEKGWPGHWFHRRIVARDLSPMCQIAYRRTALIGANGKGPMRLTLDEEARAIASNDLEFRDPARGARLTGGDAILELKFWDSLPPVFQEMVAEFDLAPRPISKYRLAVVAVIEEVTV